MPMNQWFYHAGLFFALFILPCNGTRLAEKDDESCSTYEKSFVYVNKYNPTILDLHGIVSADQARLKCLEFIELAVLKRNESVTVITGRGNHINRGGQRGTLFKLLPSWLDDCKIESYIDFFEPVDNDGAYNIFLKIAPHTQTSLREKRNMLREGQSLEEKTINQHKKFCRAQKREKHKRSQKANLKKFY